MRVGGARGCSACGEPIVLGPQHCHVLLRLKQYDVDLGGEEAAEDHGAAQTHRDAHGGGLNLWSTPRNMGCKIFLSGEDRDDTLIAPCYNSKEFTE